MKNILVLIIFIFLIFLLPSTVNGVAVILNQETVKSGKPGDHVTYYINVKNDNAYYADIKAFISEPKFNCTILKDEYLNVPPNDIIEFILIISIPAKNDIKNVSHYLRFQDRPSMEGNNDKSEHYDLDYKTGCEIHIGLIIIYEDDNGNSSIIHSPSMIIISLIISSLFCTAYYFRSRKKDLSNISRLNFLKLLPNLVGYSRLRKANVLKNPHRNEIMEIIKERTDGISFTEIWETTNIRHPSFLNYHLRRLMEFEFVSTVDDLYFPKGAPLKTPFLKQIQEAMDNGARTPSEIARVIDSYPQKVKYHMNKHGLLKVSETDFPYRKK